MRKVFQGAQAPLFFILLGALVSALFTDTVQAGGRRAAAGKTAASKKAKAPAKATAKAGRNSKAAKAGKAVARSSRNSRRNARSAPKVSQKQINALLRKRGRLSKAERQTLAAYRAAEARRRQAIIAARLRAIRARDEGLRNIAATNVLKDISTGEDLEVRRAAIEAMGGRAGTVVVMDPLTGRIYTVVNQQMALGSPVKPCSTVKLIVGLAALHEGVFDPNQDVMVSSRYGMNLTDATARSNNPVFQVLGRDLGYERVMNYSANYGFGERTGINYPGESPGFLPEEATREMPSHGDGFGVTAIQLAAFTGAIANGGNLYVPHVPRTADEAADFQPVLKRKIEMSEEDRLRILAGMIGAVNFGTAKLAYDPMGQVAGKTGTCTGASDKLGLFTSFSSIDNPKLVVTVITTGSTEAGKRAADIAGRVYRAVSFRFLKPFPVTPATTISEFPGIRSGVNPR